MMRILVIFGNIPLFGKERGNIQVLRALHEAGADVLFATNKEWGHDAIEPALDAAGLSWTPMAVARPLRRTMSARDVLKVGRDIVQGWRDLSQIIRAYRPTHIHIPNLRQALHNAPVLRSAGCPVVYRLGDDPVSASRVRTFLWRRLVVPNVTTFVCISEFIRQRAIESGVGSEAIRVIYNYPPERESKPQMDAEGNSSMEGSAGRTVVYMGQLTKEKGVDLLVEAALHICRERDDARFLIAGDYAWQNPFADKLIERVAQHGMDGRIQFLGYVEDVPGLLAASDIHVCPSVWEEPLSNVVPEAKKMGIPSVIFPSGGLPELIEHGVDGYVCSERTTKSLVDGLCYYLDMSEGDLSEAQHHAHSSLERLGITKEAFTRAWLDVYRRTGAQSIPSEDAFLAPDSTLSLAKDVRINA